MHLVIVARTKLRRIVLGTAVIDSGRGVALSRVLPLADIFSGSPDRYVVVRVRIIDLLAAEWKCGNEILARCGFGR